MKKLVILIAIGFAAYYAYGRYVSNPLVGRWNLDTEAVAASLKQLGASEQVISDYRSRTTMGKSYLNISQQEMEVSQFGERLTVKYQIESRDGKCLNVLWQGDKEPLIFCVTGGSLEMSNTQSGSLGIYKKQI